jgi:hypothetical protein
LTSFFNFIFWTEIEQSVEASINTLDCFRHASKKPRFHALSLSLLCPVLMTDRTNYPHQPELFVLCKIKEAIHSIVKRLPIQVATKLCSLRLDEVLSDRKVPLVDVNCKAFQGVSARLFGDMQYLKTNNNGSVFSQGVYVPFGSFGLGGYFQHPFFQNLPSYFSKKGDTFSGFCVFVLGGNDEDFCYKSTLSDEDEACKLPNAKNAQLFFQDAWKEEHYAEKIAFSFCNENGELVSMKKNQFNLWIRDTIIKCFLDWYNDPSNEVFARKLSMELMGDDEVLASSGAGAGAGAAVQPFSGYYPGYHYYFPVMLPVAYPPSVNQQAMMSQQYQQCKEDGEKDCGSSGHKNDGLGSLREYMAAKFPY